MPTQQFSRSSTSKQRKLPEFLGMSHSRQLKSALITALAEHAWDRLSPQGTQSGLSRRSTRIRLAEGSTEIVTCTGIPFGAAGIGSCSVRSETIFAGSFDMALA